MTDTMPTPPSTTATTSEQHQDAMEQSMKPSENITAKASQSQQSKANQGANASAAPTSTPQRSQKSRHRASVACASCRDRRIRCVVPPGESACTQCTRSGVECIIKNDDERRRPISRAYMCSLTDRVALLETMLKERGVEAPPAHHPPKTRHPLPKDEELTSKSGRKGTTGSNQHSSQTQSQQHQTTVILDNSSPGSQPSPNAMDDFIDIDQEQQDSGVSLHGEGDSAGSPSMLPPPKKDGMVSRLLSTRGHLSFDQLSGRLRYFGPTTNCHVHSDLNPASGANSLESVEQARRAEKIIRSLPLETYDYLMELFWSYYNSVLHVLHQEAFNEDREQGRTQFYSGFLHVCVLAMGFRFADKQRPDIQKISLPQMESTLHREAKYMLDHELERPGGIPSVVAMLLLGDLECGVGRDNLGWLYGGLAVRLAFDIGLHLDTRLSGLSEREVEIRQMTLWACVIYDKYWALFLGRPTSMKSSDLEIYSLAKQFERLGTCKPAGPEKSRETLIYEALIDLMELAGKITENMDPRSQLTASAVDSRNQYLRMAALDREFSNWYARLPEQLRWTPENIATAPFSFFLLHQQYHASLILLHRPFAMYEDDGSQDAASPSQHDNGMRSPNNRSPDNHFSALSRTLCTKHAIKVARIFWQHRQRFDTRQIFVTGLQHAGTAATALVAALAFIKDSADRNNNMQYLETLAAALQDMAYTYQPAERMSIVLRAVMIELRGETQYYVNPLSGNNATATYGSLNFHPDGHASTFHHLYKPHSSLVPARRGSTNDSSDLPLFKKRQTSRPRAGTGKKGGRSMSMSLSSGMSMDVSSTSSPAGGLGGTGVMKPPQQSGGYRFDGSDMNDNGFVLVPPGPQSAHSDLARHPWGGGMDAGGLSASHHSSAHTPTLDPALSGAMSSSLPNNRSGSGIWMGALSADDVDPIAALAGVHFPEINHEGLGGGHSGAGEGNNDMSHLDFLALGGGEGGENDGWGSGHGLGDGGEGGGADLDGFTAGAHGMNF